MTSKKQAKTAEPQGFNYFRFIKNQFTRHPLICSKQDFLSFQMVSWIVFFVAIMIGNALGSSIDLTPLSWLVILVVVIYAVVSFLAMVGRLHDTGRSAAWLLLSLIPYIGGVIVLIFMLQPSDSAVESSKNNPYK